MKAREYIRGVYSDLIKEHPQGQGYPQGAFLAAALEIIREVETPMREETLVRLVVLELTEQRLRASEVKAVG
ncbi:MAG: hypothetical protein RL518_800 [Pseudomonadota bacterium]|jgi:hypothetical protein